MDTAAVNLMSEQRQRYEALRQRLAASNADLAARIAADGSLVYYDPEDDCLIVTVGPPVPAVTFEATDHLNLRYEPGSYRLVAVETLGAQARMLLHPEMATTTRNLIALGMTAPAKYVPIPRETTPAVAQELGDLVCA
jgi:hypothetical protein